jgi:hypothetical protein
LEPGHPPTFATELQTTNDRVTTLGYTDAAEIEAWLESFALDQLYEPATWQELNVLCWVAAGDENILPACGRR